MKLPLTFFVFFIFIATSCKQNKEYIQGNEVFNNAHIFYYNWYGSQKKDGEYRHWAHEVIPHWSDSTWNNVKGFSGGDDIGANFYPALGCYSSNDKNIISEHFKLIKSAGIGVCVMSWWGKNSFEDKSLLTYLELAETYNIKIAFHVEPFYKSIEAFKDAINYLNTTYGNHNAIFRIQGKPLFYVYDSYKLDKDAWSSLLKTNGKISIRNTKNDGVFIGLWVHENEEDFFTDSGFDGFYTYFASDGFVYGSTTSNWSYLSKFAKKNGLLFIPSVGPGYLDTRIRPWNDVNTKHRNNGSYYKDMFRKAIAQNPEFISITSFNEWHEGTQIEPAISKRILDFTYADYGENPNYYINLTNHLISEYQSKIK
ncbi:alpha-mannosidase [Seonamhaeicola sediminis]|uniref:Alpha-mannosidase n=1 Tax=Seonamhaeicola sediminis TaxID=2528206 RepID=A0A562YI35_9FLAO|nr:glycoside hydrolase family 99 protein [Seonamhaeicola sediminis]TWO34695.1 alpha-mannosidase [Seonamhaeicola sediminis]